MNVGGEIGDSRNSHSNAFGIGGDAFGGAGGFMQEGDLALASGQALDAQDSPFKGLDQGREDWESLGDQDLALSGKKGDTDGKAGAPGPGPGLQLRGMPPAEGWKLDGQGMGQRILGQPGGSAPFLPPQPEGDNSSSNSSQGLGGGNPAPAKAATKEVQYGLGGLIEVIKMSDKDLSALALGVDLLTLGLNLNSQDCLYTFFNSPFTDQPSALESQFNIPQGYLMPQPALKPEHFSKYQLETLFYMFFTGPRDLKQACAAQELYRREWRWHGELCLWMKARSQQELMQAHPNVHFQFFEVGTWETRLFTNPYRGSLASGFLPEDEVRVKSSPGGPPS